MRNDITGRRFGHLVAMWPIAKNETGCMLWACDCDCGAYKVATAGHLLAGNVLSCGCKRSHNKRHPLYGTWRRMRQRCRDRNCEQFKNYGARGIKVCERWDDFITFVTDVGERPPGHSLDRIDNDGDYEPSNVRWATPRQQKANQRKSHAAETASAAAFLALPG